MVAIESDGQLGRARRAERYQSVSKINGNYRGLEPVNPALTEMPSQVRVFPANPGRYSFHRSKARDRKNTLPRKNGKGRIR